MLEKYVLLREVTPPQFVENAQQTPKPDAHDPESSMVSMRIAWNQFRKCTVLFFKKNIVNVMIYLKKMILFLKRPS